MLSPLDLQNKKVETKKKKYDKAEMDEYLAFVFENYTELYNKNLDLQKKVKTLSDGIQYYRSIESTMQKALVLAEKTSKETKDAAVLKAEAIEKDANSKAKKIVSEAEQEYKRIKDRCLYLVQQFNQYKIQLKQVAAAQLELITSDSFDVYSPELEKLQNENKKIPMKDAKSSKPEYAPTKKAPEKKKKAKPSSGRMAAKSLVKEEKDIHADIENKVSQGAESTVSRDLEKTMVIPDLKAELEEKSITGVEADTMSILTADTIDLSHPIQEVQRREEEQADLRTREEEQVNILRPLEPETADVQDALFIEPVEAFAAEPTDIRPGKAAVSESRPRRAVISEPGIEKLEPVPEPEKEAPTLDSLLQSMNIGSKKKKKKGQEEDPFEFLGSVDDF